MTKAFIYILTFLVALCSPAFARHRGGVANPAAPILQSVSVPFGAQTRSGRGSVRLSSVDSTTTAIQPVTFSGLDLWVGGTPCATWTETFVSGRSSGDYNLIAANTAEGASAVTPNPTSTGANNATGTYIFNISCKDAASNASNIVTLTYVTVSHAVNIGTGDRIDFGVTPSGFGNTTGGQVLLSVGADFTTNASNVCCEKMRFDGAYTNQVTITEADVARPVKLTSINTGGTLSNYRATGFTLSGAVAAYGTNLMTGAQPTGAVSNIQWDNIHAAYSAALIGYAANTSLNAFSIQFCTSNCGITDSDFDYVSTGSVLGNNVYEKRIAYRHYYNNCLFFGNVSNVDMEDGLCASPMITPGGAHVDSGQVADGATPYNVSILRWVAAQADGSNQAQGTPFAGTLLNVMGYIDDGTGSHGPGTNFTFTSGGGCLSSSNGSTIVIPSHLAYTDHVTVSCSAGSTTGTVNNLSPTVIGSPGSPVAIYGAGNQLDWNMDGIIQSQATFRGWGSNGEGGTSYYQDFMHVQQDAEPNYQASYTGSISAGGVLTISTTPTINYPGEGVCVANCGRLSYSGCAYCGPTVNGQLTGTANGIGTYTVGSPAGAVGTQTMNNSNSYPVGNNNAGWIYQNNCTNTTVHAGTLTIRSGYAQNGWAGCNPLPANTTQASSYFGKIGDGAGSLTGSAFASGVTPQTYLQGLTWNTSVTNDDIKTRNCLAVKPKIGGPLDAGGGVWYGAVTGETNAITHTGGGNWNQNGVDSGIPAGAVSASYPQGCAGAP